MKKDECSRNPKHYRLIVNRKRNKRKHIHSVNEIEQTTMIKTKAKREKKHQII